MSRELISWDALNGIAQYHNYDPITDTSTFESVGDAGPCLDFNKAVANDAEVTRKGIKDGWWWYAQIPAIVQVKLMAEHNICIWKKEDGPRLSKILELPEYRHLKMTTKKHIISSHD